MPGQETALFISVSGVLTEPSTSIRGDTRPRAAVMSKFTTASVAIVVSLSVPAAAQVPGAGGGTPAPPRQMEALGRGVVAVNPAGGQVFVSWRLLGTDPDDVAFNLYRATGDGDPVRLNGEPLQGATCFVDESADTGRTIAYSVRPVVGGKEQ